MTTYNVLHDCERPPAKTAYGTVIAPNGSRHYLPSDLHGCVLRELLPHYRRTW